MATYSFLDVQATIVGPGGSVSMGSESGAAQEGISFEQTDPLNKMDIGADGTPQHNLHASRGAKITVRLLKTSPTNALLGALLEFQRQSGATHGQNVINISNIATFDNNKFLQCAFAVTPNNAYAMDANVIEWHFDAGRSYLQFGANV